MPEPVALQIFLRHYPGSCRKMGVIRCSHRWAMALEQNRHSKESSLELRLLDRLKLGLVGTLVIFASLGLGEAVYRLAYFDFDGATDRLPIEMLFGLAFAWMTMKLAKRIHQNSVERSARINL